MTSPTSAADGSYPPHGQTVAVSTTISSGSSLSSAIDLGNSRVFAFQMPSGWTTANLTFQASYDGSTYANLFDSTGTEVQVNAAASEYIVIASPVAWLGIRYLKVRSGTSGTPVNQGADRSIQVVTVF